MIKYETYVAGYEGMYKSFESEYEFKLNERLFFKNDKEEIVQLLITKITHDLTSDFHVVRLNCQFRKIVNTDL